MEWGNSVEVRSGKVLTCEVLSWVRSGKVVGGAWITPFAP